MTGSPSRLRYRITRLIGERALGPLRLTRTSGSIVILIAAGVLAAATYLSARPDGGRASPSNAPKTGLTKPIDLSVEVVDSETQQPIAQAEVIAEEPYKKRLAAGKTDEMGRVQLKLPAVRSRRKPRRPFVRVQAQGYTTMASFWTAQWIAKGPLHYKMPRLARYGGIVRDHEGNGIEGVEVQISSFFNSPIENSPYSFVPPFKARTDAEGKWTTNVLPAKNPDFGIRLSHPEYSSDAVTRGTGHILGELRAGTAVMIIEKAVRLAGRVTDADGKPVSSATVRLGDSLAGDFPATRTDDRGMFTLKSVLPGPHILTVQHPHFAPALLRTEAGKDGEPIRVVLRPGGTITGRVVDKDGKGLVGIRITATGTWQGYHTLKMGTMTLTDGRFTLKNCPKEPIGFTFRLADFLRSADRQYMARFVYPMQPRTEPYRIVLHPPLAITGRVADGETGRPIDEFTVIPESIDHGGQQARRPGVDAKRFRGGRYEMSFTSPRGQRLIRVEAKGYAPAVSRAYADDEGEQVCDFELKKSAKGKLVVLDLGNDVKLELVLIPLGEFMMGSPEGEKARRDNEGPQHRVRITKPFYMGKYEVTQGQWQAVMGQNPSYFTGSDDLPVEQVNWEDCQAFCKKVSAKVGMRIRLPSEAEWEYACRAGTRTRYSYGGSMHPELGQYGWYDANSEGKTHRVGSLKPNPWGLYDMHGNVGELCQDVYHKGYGGAPADGSAWVSGGDEGSARVVRGGTWFNYDAGGCRSAQRGGGRPDARHPLQGFRVSSGTR